jgi:hypothetical protein
MPQFIEPPSGANWRPLPGFPGYWATDHGKIWSGRRRGEILNPGLDHRRNRYPVVCLKRNGSSTNRYVHTLIGLVFPDSPAARAPRPADGEDSSPLFKPVPVDGSLDTWIPAWLYKIPYQERAVQVSKSLFVRSGAHNVGPLIFKGRYTKHVPNWIPYGVY